MQRSILLVSLVVSTVVNPGVIIIRVVTKAVIQVVKNIRVVKHIPVVTKAVTPVVTYRVTETYNKNPRQLKSFPENKMYTGILDFLNLCIAFKCFSSTDYSTVVFLHVNNCA